jgi:hypothetical protein
MNQWEATLKANPEDQTACRELNALFFTPFFVDTTGATLRPGQQAVQRGISPFL